VRMGCPRLWCEAQIRSQMFASVHAKVKICSKPVLRGPPGRRRAPGLAEELHRVDRRAVETHLEVEVGPAADPRTARHAKRLPG